MKMLHRTSSHSSLPFHTHNQSVNQKDDVKYFKRNHFQLTSVANLTRQTNNIIKRYVSVILADTRYRKVFFFLLLNLSFTVVEALYGVWTNSLGLMSDAVHMLFDSTAIICSLIASVIAKWDANDSFTYGFGRVETLAGFVNAVALFMATLGIIWEAIERFFDPKEIETDKLLIISVLGFFVNLVGIFAFDHGGMHHGHSHGCTHGHSHSEHEHGHSHSNHETPLLSSHSPVHVHDHHSHNHSHDHDHSHSHNHNHDHNHNHNHNHHHSNSHSHSHSHHHNHLLHGMFLHVLADTLGSVGVIISSILIKYFGWLWSDPICSLFISALILGSTWPLLKNSTEVLLQRTPHGWDTYRMGAYHRLSSLPNVTSVSSIHIWELSHDHWVGTCKVVISPDGNEQKTRFAVTNVLKEWGCKDVTVQVDKDVMVGY